MSPLKTNFNNRQYSISPEGKEIVFDIFTNIKELTDPVSTIYTKC